MKPSFHFVALVAATASLQTFAGEPKDPLCAPLQAFVASVVPGESRALIFHTRWGANFKDSVEDAVSAKRCIHSGYAPAKAVCELLMERGSVEVSGNNGERALMCLSPGTRFARRIDMLRGAFSFKYGTEERGSNVKLLFDEDLQLGGMALQIVADGY